MLAMISSKNRSNGARNPRAMFQEEVSVEDIMNAPGVGKARQRPTVSL